MVRYIFASHYRMADGLKETIEFLTSVKENVYAVSAYTLPRIIISKRK